MSKIKIRSRANDEEVGIDLTSMLDMVFIMLIFFIVTSSFVKEAGIEVNRPSAKTATKKGKANLFIAIAPDGAVWIDKRQVDVRSVAANVRHLKAEGPEGGVIIQVDKEAKSGMLVQVMDQIRDAGITNISIAANEVE